VAFTASDNLAHGCVLRAKAGTRGCVLPAVCYSHERVVKGLRALAWWCVSRALFAWHPDGSTAVGFVCMLTFTACVSMLTCTAVFTGSHGDGLQQ
jgi:hypothetical protein